MDLTATEAEWDERKEAVKCKDKARELRTNAILNKNRSTIEELFYDARLNGTPISAKAFQEIIDTKPNEQNFLEFLEREIQNEVTDREASTVKTYRTLLGHLKAFWPDASFGDISYDFIQRFDRWLKGKGIGDNARAKYHTLLRKFVLIAKKKKRRLENPYEQWKIKSVEVQRTWLNVDEVHRLTKLYRDKSLPNPLQEALRHFLFQVVASVRISDIHKIKHTDIEGPMLIFAPQKTKGHNKIVKIPLSQLARELIADGEGQDGFIFDPPADALTNLRLKDIARIAGISKRLTTHVGRHTFGFLYLLMGGKVEELREIFGHSKLETTQVYTHTDHDKKMAGVLKFDSIFLAE